jgi:uncharacterized MAPEG superfamily protein
MVTHSPELVSTALAASFTGLMWIPIIANRLAETGIWKALKNPQPDLRPHADWAYRLANAHRNAIENLVVFAPLAIAIDILGVGNDLTASAGTAFVASRIAHAVIYTFGIPLLRTLAFAIGFGCQVIYAVRIFGLI